MSTLLPVHQMPASGDPLGSDQVAGPRGRTSHRSRDDHDGPDRDTQGFTARSRGSRGRVTISPSAPSPLPHPAEAPIGAGPYPPRPDPWTVGTGSWPLRTEGFTTGSIPVIPPDRPRSLRPVLVAGITLAWLLMIGLALLLGRADGIGGVALFGHLVFLAIGFGAVLAIGLNGLALLVRWVRVSRVVTLAVVLDPLIWLGLGGLALTGLLLDPNLGSLWTWLKLLAVLAVGINGLAHRDLMIELGRLPTRAGRRALSPALLRRAVRVSATTQVGWWLAVVIGYLS